jgi:hypothetical protein
LTGPGHSCLQDNKSLHILRNAHFRARSMDWNRAVASCDPDPSTDEPPRHSQGEKTISTFCRAWPSVRPQFTILVKQVNHARSGWPGGKSLEVSRPNSKQNP